MFITYEMLEKTNANTSNKNWFQNNYPDGANISQLINNPHIPYAFLHWLYNYTPFFIENVQQYNIILNNYDSSMVFESDNINKSNMVSRSSQVINSSRIFRSKDITNSNLIVSSDCVEESNQIFLSSFVYSSEKIYNSNNVTNCTNIVDSVCIIDSHNIYACQTLTNCGEIRRGNDLEDCYFCNDCSGLKHCFGCQGLEAGEYLIFNKQVTELQFNTIKKQYLSMMECLLQYTHCWPTELYSAEVPTIDRNFTHHYQTIPPKFWKWVKTLPNYSDNHMFYLTSLPEFLTK